MVLMPRWEPGVPQSEGVSGLVAGVLQSSGNPLRDGPPSTPLMKQAPAWKVGGSATAFHHNSLTSDDDFTFDTREVITEYLETHFRSSLHKDVRSAMHKAHPIPRTPVMQVPKVDRFVLDHLN